MELRAPRSGRAPGARFTADEELERNRSQDPIDAGANVAIETPNLTLPVEAVVPAGSAAEDDPLWYKDAIIYQAHVKSFFDSDNNGIGDFPGITQKLEYLQSLGITCLWLL